MFIGHSWDIVISHEWGLCQVSFDFCLLLHNLSSVQDVEADKRTKQPVSNIISEECGIGGLMVDLGLRVLQLGSDKSKCFILRFQRLCPLSSKIIGHRFKDCQDSKITASNYYGIHSLQLPMNTCPCVNEEQFACEDVGSCLPLCTFRFCTWSCSSSFSCLSFSQFKCKVNINYNLVTNLCNGTNFYYST